MYPWALVVSSLLVLTTSQPCRQLHSALSLPLPPPVPSRASHHFLPNIIFQRKTSPLNPPMKRIDLKNNATFEIKPKSLAETSRFSPQHLFFHSSSNLLMLLPSPSEFQDQRIGSKSKKGSPQNSSWPQSMLLGKAFALLIFCS